jgi:hypothetical protein
MTNTQSETQPSRLLKAVFGTVQHFFGDWTTIFSGVTEPRNPNMITYPLASLMFTGILSFICRLGSRRGVKDYLRDNDPSAEKIGALFGVEMVPHGDTLNYACKRLDVDEVQEVVCWTVETLIRKKVLYRYRLLDIYFTIAIDGTGVLTFHKRHCEHCLTKKLSNGETLYYHPVLEAKLVTPNGFAFSIMTEFIENSDLSADKQDCELKAFYRLTQRIKQRFPRLPICLLLDGLYAAGPTFSLCETYGWKYFVVLCEGDLPNVHRSYAAALPHLPHNHKTVQVTHKNLTVTQIFHWANSLAYTDAKGGTHQLALLECHETQTKDQAVSANLHYKWLTNFTLTSVNVERLANQGARLRWKIENEGFNVQKTSELNLEHPYSEHANARKIFYLLIQMAHTFFQLIQHGSLLLDFSPNRLRTAKILAFRILEVWRNLSLSAQALNDLSSGKYQVRFDTS